MDSANFFKYVSTFLIIVSCIMFVQTSAQYATTQKQHIFESCETACDRLSNYGHGVSCHDAQQGSRTSSTCYCSCVDRFRGQK